MSGLIVLVNEGSLKNNLKEHVRKTVQNRSVELTLRNMNSPLLPQ